MILWVWVLGFDSRAIPGKTISGIFKSQNNDRSKDVEQKSKEVSQKSSISKFIPENK